MEIKERSLDELHLSVCVNISNFRFFSGPKEQKIETTLIKISLIFFDFMIHIERMKSICIMRGSLYI